MEPHPWAHLPRGQLHGVSVEHAIAAVVPWVVHSRPSSHDANGTVGVRMEFSGSTGVNR